MQQRTIWSTGDESFWESVGKIESGERQLGHVLFYNFFKKQTGESAVPIEQNQRNNLPGKRNHGDGTD